MRVAGVDGGGSGSRALVVDGSGRERGSGEGPPGRVAGLEGSGAAADAVEEAVRSALQTAGEGPSLAALWCGLAGAGEEEAREAVQAILQERNLAAHVRVGTDARAAFRDAFGPGGAGVLLVAGTGSIALGRSKSGERVRVGGWGSVLGDEGSGYRLGLEGMKAVLRAHDGRAEATALRRRLLAATGAEGPRGLVGFAARASKAAVAALAPEVVREAEAGDGPARRIVDGAVRELVTLVETAVERVGGMEPDAEIVLAGGLVGPGRPLGEAVESALRRRGRRVARREVRAERGAARLALEAASGPTGR